jgi:hypothetical protein
VLALGSSEKSVLFLKVEQDSVVLGLGFDE